MARKPKQAFTFENNIDKVTDKIEESPYKVMNILGQTLTREIRATTLKTQFHRRSAILSKALGYWARKREKDLQIGFKMSIPGIVGDMILGKEEDPIKPVVIKNIQNIQDMIRVALDEIGKR